MSKKKTSAVQRIATLALSLLLLISVFGFQNNTQKVRAAIPVTPVTPPTVQPYTVKIGVSSVARGQKISVNWSAPVGHSKVDWVSIYTPSEPHTAWKEWYYTGSATSGTMIFTAPSTPGTYEFRYLLHNDMVFATKTATFTVR